MKLDASLLFLGLSSFMLICVGAVLFSFEKKLFGFLKKSVFSKFVIVLVVAGYLVSIGLINHKTEQRLNDIDIYSDIKNDFQNVNFLSSFQNTLLLKNIVIVDIQDKFDIEDVKQIIIKKIST